jgi:hypothetical protein
LLSFTKSKVRIATNETTNRNVTLLVAKIYTLELSDTVAIINYT